MRVSRCIPFVALFVLMLSFLPQQAQQYQQSPERHTLSMRMFTLGYASLPYKSSTYHWDRVSGNMSYLIGFDYTFWFNHHVGVSTGLELNYILNNVGLGALSSESRGPIVVSNTEGDREVMATFRAESQGLEENQIFLMFELPVMLSLQSQNLFCNLGVSFATSLTSYSIFTYQPSSYSILDVDELDNSFSADPILAEIEESVEGEYTPADIKHPLFFMLGGEVGWKFYFNHRNMLSVSLYGRFALNACKVDKVEERVRTFSIAYGQSQSLPPLSSGMVDSFRYYVLGLGVTYHLGFGRPMSNAAAALRSQSKSLL
ncbi:MAG: hypothetical protein IJ764_00630 [Bacteroidales bacterium]|nr:hypothetical protein [Bacteroidales bacterium]